MSAFGTNVPCVIPFSDGLVRSWESFWERVVLGRELGVGWGICPVWVLPNVSFLRHPGAGVRRQQGRSGDTQLVLLPLPLPAPGAARQ